MARTFLDALSKLQKVLQTVSGELFHEEQMDEMPEPSSPSPDVDAYAAPVATTTVGFGSLPVKLIVSRC